MRFDALSCGRMRPVELGPNQPRQFYLGGAAISAFRGTQAQDAYRPEDWVGSATRRFGMATDGLSRLPGGEYLRDAVSSDPGAWLGPDHAGFFGTSPALLVKLLDAGERLPVHVHPTRSFALQHLGSRHGKTESWVVVGTKGAEPVVYLGWVRDVEEGELRRWVHEQETKAMLGNLHRLAVAPGDTVVVPAGTPHAIGEGVFAVELQEPTDFSVMLEMAGFDIDPAGGELGLGRDLAVSCVQRRALTEPALDNLVLRQSHASGAPVQSVLAQAAAPYFRAQRVRPQDAMIEFEASFAVLIALEGSGELAGEGWELPVHAGHTWVVPWSAGVTEVGGNVELLRCLPPLPADTSEDPLL
jgi:mannose-6-phosphate isomerase